MKRDLVKALQLGFTIALSVGGFTLVGYMADNHLNKSPLFTVVGVLFGVINAFFYLYKWSKR